MKKDVGDEQLLEKVSTMQERLASMKANDFTSGELNEELKEALIKQANPVALDAALAGAINSKIQDLMRWIAYKKAYITYLRPDISLLQTGVLEEELEKLSKQ